MRADYQLERKKEKGKKGENCLKFASKAQPLILVLGESQNDGVVRGAWCVKYNRAIFDGT